MSVTENPDKIDLEKSAFKDGESSIFNIEPIKLIEKTDERKAFVILNQQINLSPEYFKVIWESSPLRICADGGSNRLREFITIHNLNQDEYLPDFIIGDMDSITQETRDYFEGRPKKVIIKSQISQYYSDLDKCISLINIYFNESDKFESLLNSFDDYDQMSEYSEKHAEHYITNGSKEITVILLGGIGGRFDQTIHTLNKVAINESGKVSMKFMIFNNEYNEVIFMVKGRSFIEVPFIENSDSTGTGTVLENRKVGLLPLITESEIICTKGLKWDVQNWKTSMKSAVSSSNYIVGSTGFYIDVSEPIYINMEF